MKIVLVGANGTIGKHVFKALQGSGHEIIRVGRKSGDFKANIENVEEIKELYKKIGKFDAVVNASGDVAFAPLNQLTKENWDLSLRSKLMGQISLVQEALPYINEGGSFTLISGILGDEQIMAGTAAATVNYALEGFVKAAAFELPKGLRINLVSPTLLEDSVGVFGPYFPGFAPVAGDKVGLAFKKSVMGIQSGKVLRVF